nr:reverse transcriptase domain-containing protein [Tanacetum cinerariifolium]
MSAMANTTPIVTTVTKITTKEKTPNEAKGASRVNILEFCEEHYEDSLPRHLPPSTTKSGPDMEYFRDGSYSRGRPHKRDSSPSRDRSHDIEESCGKFKPPLPMVTPVLKRSSNKFCEFQNDKVHNTNECVQLRKKIEELRVTRQKVTQSFAYVKEITFPSLAANKGTLGPLVIEAKISGHAVQRIYVEGGSSMETVKALGKFRGRRALYKCMDEFYDNEVTITIQRHHSKARDKINPSSTIHSSRNAQIPNEWRNSNYPPRDYYWRNSIDKSTNGTVHTLKEKLKYIRMAAVRHDRSTTIDYRAPTQYPRRILPCQTEKRGQAPEHAKAIQVEVQKLIEAGILREVYYHDWLSNPIMVKKYDGSWRMCVDFIDLNKACPQDCYPLSEIDWKVESLCGYPLSVSWIPTKAIIKYRWPNKMRKRRVSTPVTGQEVVYILPDVSYHGHHRPAHQASDVASRRQILTDFLVEKSDDALPEASMIKTPQEPWTLFTDGSSCVDGLGVGLILTNPEGTEFTYALRFQFTASNNKVEYKELIAGLWIAAHIGVRNVHVSIDSTKQVLGTYVAKEENMVKYLEKAKSLISGFANFSITQLPKSKNKKADVLSKIESTSFAHLSKQVLVEVLKEKSILEKEVATVVEEDGPTWMTSIMEYLKYETLLGDRKEASKLRIKARQYELLEGVLYRRSFLKPWLGRSFLEGPGKVKFLIVAMDYFTKWIETKSMATITGSQVKKFVWDNIVCRFGLPGEIVSDNEIRMPTYRTVVVDIVHNNEEIWLNLDLLEERRECVAIREVKAKLKMTKYYNTRVRGITFRHGDFVYRSNEASHAMDEGKLGLKWEGPYEVTEVLRDGAHRVRSMDGTVLPRT